MGQPLLSGLPAVRALEADLVLVFDHQLHEGQIRDILKAKRG